MGLAEQRQPAGGDGQQRQGAQEPPDRVGQADGLVAVADHRAGEEAEPNGEQHEDGQAAPDLLLPRHRDGGDGGGREGYQHGQDRPAECERDPPRRHSDAGHDPGHDGVPARREGDRRTEDVAGGDGPGDLAPQGSQIGDAGRHHERQPDHEDAEEQDDVDPHNGPEPGRPVRQRHAAHAGEGGDDASPGAEKDPADGHGRGEHRRGHRDGHPDGWPSRLARLDRRRPAGHHLAGPVDLVRGDDVRRGDVVGVEDGGHRERSVRDLSPSGRVRLANGEREATPPEP